MSNTCTKVFLRRRPYAGGKVSLYLDYYPAIRNPHTNKMTRCKTLGIVIFAEPANEMLRRFNQEMKEKAEAIRYIRYQSLVNEQLGFLDKTKLKMDFLTYFEKKARSKYDKWMSVYLHFKKLCCGRCTFGDKWQEVKEEYLTLDEMKILDATECEVPTLKHTALSFKLKIKTYYPLHDPVRIV